MVLRLERAMGLEPTTTCSGSRSGSAQTEMPHVGAPELGREVPNRDDGLRPSRQWCAFRHRGPVPKIKIRNGRYTSLALLFTRFALWLRLLTPIFWQPTPQQCKWPSVLPALIVTRFQLSRETSRCSSSLDEG